jgi:hypothetical protein
VSPLLRVTLFLLSLAGAGAGVVYQGRQGPGRGKHVVFVAADQEYRSEESMPAFARLLAERHGFRCTVLLPINKQTGEIDAQTDDNIPGLEALRTADLMVLFLRFQELPDEQMKWIVDYTNSGRPILALRTSTHSFNYRKHLDSPYARYSFRSTDPAGGYGRLVLGETWINHYGVHQKESTRGIAAPDMAAHPILRGVGDLWGPSDVYAITTLSGDAKPVLMGQVLSGMEPSSPPNPDKKLTPVAWIKTYTGSSGRSSRVFTTTMGHPGDFRSEGFRRMLVNACYWALTMEKRISAHANVDFVGGYNPTPIGFGKDRRGVRLSDLQPTAAR